MVGVQAQIRSAAGLALRARTEGLTATEVDHALGRERSIVRTWAMRGTLHLIAAEDHGWLVPLTSEGVFTGSDRRLKQLGVTAEQAGGAVRAVQRMLSRDGPLTRHEIAERLARRRIPMGGQALIHLIRRAALEGLVCLGWRDDGEECFVLVRDWLPPVRPVERDTALAELTRRYLAVHAPAGPEDLAAWAGIRLGDVRRGWTEMASSLTQVRTATGPLWAPGGLDFHPPEGVVRLVPSFDEYLLGWRNRDLALPARHAPKIFPGGGMLRPAVISNGLVVGRWSTERRGSRRRVQVEPLSSPTPAVRRALEAEAKDIGRYAGSTAELTIG